MAERICKDCGKPFLQTPGDNRSSYYCPACRLAFKFDEQSDLSGRNYLTQKGRDRFSERLRDGFDMLDDDDHSDIDE